MECSCQLPPVQGGADCQGNPWHPVTIELEEALGDRTVYDGRSIPPWERSWPPTQDSLQTMGDAG